MKKKKWNRFLSVVVTAAMLVAPLQGFSFVDDLFTTAGVTTKASAQDIAQTDTSQKIGTYPYCANEPAIHQRLQMQFSYTICIMWERTQSPMKTMWLTVTAEAVIWIVILK